MLWFKKKEEKKGPTPEELEKEILERSAEAALIGTFLVAATASAVGATVAGADAEASGFTRFSTSLASDSSAKR